MTWGKNSEVRILHYSIYIKLLCGTGVLIYIETKVLLEGLIGHLLSDYFGYRYAQEMKDHDGRSTGLLLRLPAVLAAMI